MRVSKKTEYGIHSVLYIAVHRDSPVLLDKLSEQGVSRDYLAKVMRSLTKMGILRSSVGVSGGYVLGREPEEISFKDIFLACEGEPEFICARGARECDADDSCGIIVPFKNAYEKMLEELSKVTIQDLINKSSITEFELNWLR